MQRDGGQVDPTQASNAAESDGADLVSGTHANSISTKMINFEVRLAFSGLPVARVQLKPWSTVSELERIVAASRTWPPGARHLFLGARALESSSWLADVGVREGSVVTVACAALRWHDKAKGMHAELSEDGLTAKRRDGQFKFNHAVLISNGPVREFRFQVLDSSARFAGGLELGFTSVAPEELLELGEVPHSAVCLRHAWICDCHGELHAYTGSFHALDMDFGEQDWDPERLRTGDIVTCRALVDGRLQIEINGHEVGNWEAGIANDIDLYPVVGLFGKTTAIRLIRQGDSSTKLDH